MGEALTKQIVIRVPDDLLAALTADAEENGRTLAQSVRFLLRRSLAGAQEGTETPRRPPPSRSHTTPGAST